MGRARCYAAYADAAGNKLSGTSVHVYQPGTTTVITETIFDSFSAGGALANPLTTDANGAVLFYLANPKRVDLLFLRAGYADYTLRNAQVIPDAADILLLASVIDGAQLGTGTVANAALAADVARATLLTNGGFEVWQRGTGPFTLDAAYTADRWRLFVSTSTVSVTLINSTIGRPGNSMQAAYTHAAGGSVQVIQYPEDPVRYGGSTVSLRMSVKSTVAGTTFLRIQDSAGETNSPRNVGTAQENLAVTRVIAGTDVRVMVCVDTATCTVEINDAMLVVGNTASVYVPLHPADELARCQRYYEVHSTSWQWYGNAPGANVQTQHRSFSSRKAVAPVFAKLGTWSVANCGQPNTSGNMEGYALATTAVAAGYFTCLADTADDQLVFEANP